MLTERTTTPIPKRKLWNAMVRELKKASNALEVSKAASKK